jgi:hydrogenase nickel incorporation protein HypA/HybF
MHEASLMKGLMHRIGEIAAADKALRVTGVSVWLGALSHMSAAHFTEHFEQAAAGGIAEGAKLTIEESRDSNHPEAQDIVLKSVEIET